MSVRPPYSFHLVESKPDGRVRQVRDAQHAGVRINGGGYVLRSEIFDYLGSGEDLVDQPFERLATEDRIGAFEHDGFWLSLDTLKDMQTLQDLEERGQAPWAMWRGADAEAGAPTG